MPSFWTRPAARSGARVNCACKAPVPALNATCPMEDGNPNFSVDRTCGSCSLLQACLVSETSDTGSISCKCLSTSTPTPTPIPTSTPTPAPSPTSTPAPTPTCEYPAYDDSSYCRCPGPRPSPIYQDKIEVSVCGDATYLLPAGSNPCSGPTSKESDGTDCPKKGDKTTIACRSEILSYLTGESTGTCEAPEDAQCEKLNTGAWGCVFPGNCNAVNDCLEQNVCTDEYKKNADGTCQVADNGYVVPAAHNTAKYDTTKLTELKQKDPSGNAMHLGLSFSMTIFTFVLVNAQI